MASAPAAAGDRLSLTVSAARAEQSKSVGIVPSGSIMRAIAATASSPARHRSCSSLHRASRLPEPRSPAHGSSPPLWMTRLPVRRWRVFCAGRPRTFGPCRERRFCFRRIPIDSPAPASAKPNARRTSLSSLARRMGPLVECSGASEGARTAPLRRERTGSQSPAKEKAT
jgi:hypothetical protein